MSEFYLVYQPKVRDNKIIAVEALLRPYQTDLGTFLHNLKDTMTLDIKVISTYCDEFAKHDLIYPVSLNIHPDSLLDSDFIDFCVSKLRNRMVTLELIETQNITVSETLKRHTARLKNNNIKISIDDFSFEYSRLDVAIEISVDEIKFDGSLISDIDYSYFKFKYLVTLYSRFINLGIKNIVFEKVETKLQNDLITAFCDDAIIQGYYYYKPMPMEDLLLEDLTICESYTSPTPEVAQGLNNIDYFIYRQVIKHGAFDLEMINNTVKKLDVLGTIYNKDPKLSLKNLRDIYFNNDNISNHSVMSLFNNTDKLIIVRNDEGVVVYDNFAHRNLVGTSLVGMDVNTIIQHDPPYTKCIQADQDLLDSDQSFFTSKEVFYDVSYGVVREKMYHNDRPFVVVTVAEPDDDILLNVLDPLTQCFTRAYLNKLDAAHGHVLAFIDLNGFKSINDNIGHDVGDRCLVEFVGILKSTLRDNDIIIRYGGDEFIILFYSRSLKTISSRLHDINNIVKTYFENKSISLSFSFGLALLDSENVEESIKLADTKMYLAKKQFKLESTISYTI